MFWLVFIVILAVFTAGYLIFLIWAVASPYSLSKILVRSSAKTAVLDEMRLSEVRAQKARMARPTVLFEAGDGAVLSRLGGAPSLPLGCEWPVGRDGPMGFLCQVDLTEVRAAGGPDWLPGQGLLCLFHNEDYGMADQGRVLHVAAQDAVTTPPPTLSKTRRYRERGVRLRGFSSVPSMDWLGVIAGEGEAWDDLIDDDAQSFGEGPQHRLGGYPCEIQNEKMAVSCEHYSRGLFPYDQKAPPDADLLAAAEAWRLLFQVDSDETLGTNWRDGGLLYVFIREEDARAGDFSKTVTLSQTH